MGSAGVPAEHSVGEESERVFGGLEDSRVFIFEFFPQPVDQIEPD